MRIKDIKLDSYSIYPNEPTDFLLSGLISGDDFEQTLQSIENLDLEEIVQLYDNVTCFSFYSNFLASLDKDNNVTLLGLEHTSEVEHESKKHNVTIPSRNIRGHNVIDLSQKPNILAFMDYDTYDPLTFGAKFYFIVRR